MQQTAKRALEHILMGEREWTAVGNFQNYWYGDINERRPELIREPLPTVPADDLHGQRWAAFLAAYVEYLCEKYHEPCPTWVYEPRYILTEPFYVAAYPAGDFRDEERKETPAVFAKRNVYLAERHLETKWEFAARIREQFKIAG
jgi:hypothetical protein